MSNFLMFFYLNPYCFIWCRAGLIHLKEFSMQLSYGNSHKGLWSLWILSHYQRVRVNWGGGGEGWHLENFLSFPPHPQHTALPLKKTSRLRWEKVERGRIFLFPIPPLVLQFESTGCVSNALLWSKHGFPLPRLCCINYTEIAVGGMCLKYTPFSHNNLWQTLTCPWLFLNGLLAPLYTTQ